MLATQRLIFAKNMNTYLAMFQGSSRSMEICTAYCTAVKLAVVILGELVVTVKVTAKSNQLEKDLIEYTNMVHRFNN